MARRVLAALLALALGLAGAVLLALGTCHDSGGFCAETFSSTHVFLYVVGVVLLSAGAGVLAGAFTLRRAVAAGVAGLAAALLVVLVVAVETAARS